MLLKKLISIVRQQTENSRRSNSEVAAVFKSKRAKKTLKFCISRYTHRNKTYISLWVAAANMHMRHALIDHSTLPVFTSFVSRSYK